MSENTRGDKSLKANDEPQQNVKLVMHERSTSHNQLFNQQMLNLSNNQNESMVEFMHICCFFKKIHIHSHPLVYIHQLALSTLFF